MKDGDFVYPSIINPFKFNKNTKFPCQYATYHFSIRIFPVREDLSSQTVNPPILCTFHVQATQLLSEHRSYHTPNDEKLRYLYLKLHELNLAKNTREMSPWIKNK